MTKEHRGTFGPSEEDLLAESSTPPLTPPRSDLSESDAEGSPNPSSSSASHIRTASFDLDKDGYTPSTSNFSQPYGWRGQSGDEYEGVYSGLGISDASANLYHSDESYLDDPYTGKDGFENMPLTPSPSGSNVHPPGNLTREVNQNFEPPTPRPEFQPSWTFPQTHNINNSNTTPQQPSSAPSSEQSRPIRRFAGPRHFRTDSITKYMRFSLSDFPAPISITPGPLPPSSRSKHRPHPSTSYPHDPAAAALNANSPPRTPRSWYFNALPPTPANPLRLTFAYPQARSWLERMEWIRDTEAFWLGLYFMFNLALTLYNKSVLDKFPFPYTLTAVHALCGTIGCNILLGKRIFVPARLNLRESTILAAFSVLYTVNIAVSNVSLQLVTVPFHQVVRGSTPLFILVLSYLFFRTSVTCHKMLSIFPIVLGVAFATYGDYYFTSWGLFLTLFGTFLAALKTIITNVLQTRPISRSGRALKLHPLDLLMRMSPLALIQCVAYAWYSGELDRVREYGATRMDWGKALALTMNGVIAFGLNVVSFTANKKAGALTMTVAANIKQVLTIILAVSIFNLKVSTTNSLGILLTLGGGAWYAAVEYSEKAETRKVGALLGLVAHEEQGESGGVSPGAGTGTGEKVGA